jgi:formamidopyrimidine-DNA glycosylase
MPELAEVEFFRKQWDAGLGAKIARVAMHGDKRLFRGLDTARLAAAVTGATLVSSEARAKQMLFGFKRGRERAWLGVHLGMTGKLSVAPRDFAPGRHEHLVLFQKSRALVFRDPRVFGRVLFAEGADLPAWWTRLPPAVTSSEFTLDLVRAFLKRRARLAVKGALLVQSAFPGVGNWMADEILWRARISPRTLCGSLSSARATKLWEESREVCRIAMETVGVDFSDPPADWLFHERWSPHGHCPRCGDGLKTATIAGRTTRWCGRCQR